MARSLKKINVASGSRGVNRELWRTIWKMFVLPRIKLFAWKVGAQALASKASIGRRIQNFCMGCDVCGAVEESDIHVLFECPLAVEVWRASEFGEEL